MKSSPAFKLFIFLLLPLTLGWKLAVRAAESDDPQKQARAVQAKVADFLTRQHFAVTISGKMEEGLPSIQASAGACRILVARSPSMGWDRDLIRRRAAPGDHVFVVFGGKVYAEQPTWLTVPDFLWARLQRELGLNAQAQPVFAVIGTPVCDAERLPWVDLQA